MPNSLCPDLRDQKQGLQRVLEADWSFHSKKEALNHLRKTLLICLLWFFAVPFSNLAAQQTGDTFPIPASNKLSLGRTFMCEAINNEHPVNETIIFPVSNGKAVCFTYLSQVPKRTTIYHNWYKTDKLTTQIPLEIEPRQTASFSSIPLRDSYKGPWRVEIMDREGNLLKTLRFSVTE